MPKTSWNTDTSWGLSTPTRNNYFYGKLLDEFHLELEQDYFNRKRWLLNRMTLGHGVVCGLKVMVTNNGCQIRVSPGMAIDKRGREIIVPQTSRPIDPFTPTETDPCGQSMEPSPTPTPPPLECVHVCLAYHECESELAPVLVGECGTEQRCAPSTILERYKILVRAGPAPRGEPVTCSKALHGVFDSNTFNYENLVEWTLQGCPPPLGSPPVGHPCVVLAEIDLTGGGCGLKQDAIDMTVRPIVFSNLLLRELVICLARRCGIIVDLDP
jgi:hypothetical protein